MPNKKVFLILNLCIFMIILYIILTPRSKEDLESIKDIKLIKNDGSIKNLKKTENNTFRKFVIISCDVRRERYFYFFQIPIVALAWRRILFEPIVMIISSDAKNINPLAQKTIEYLEKSQIQMIHVNSPVDYETMVSMISRCFVGVSDENIISDEDFILTSDSDLYPVSLTYLNNIDLNSIFIFNAFCCGKFNLNGVEYNMYPLSHIGMKKKHWRNVMQLDFNHKLDGKTILKKIESIYGTSYCKKNNEIARGDAVWYTDQKTISMFITKYLQDHKLVNLQLTGWPIHLTRLDRSFSNDQWINTVKDISKVFDSHAFHTDIFEKWTLLQMLYSQIFDNKTNNFIENYQKEFKRLI